MEDVIMHWILLSMACNLNEPDTFNKEVIITGGGHATANAADYEAFRFTCCDSPHISDVIEAYLLVTRSLANDNLGDAQQHGETMRAAIEKAQEHTALPASSLTGLSEMNRLSMTWHRSEMVGIRADLGPLSDKAVDLAKQHKGGDTQIITAFCPMAPGRWLQTESTIANPYYGSGMLTCGIFEE